MKIQTFNKKLNDLRETFHKYGTFNDSNAKLDEIVKIIAICIYQIKTDDLKPIGFNSLLTNFQSDKSYNLKDETNKLFLHVANSDFYRDHNDNSIFGNRPELLTDNIQSSLLLQLMVTVEDIVSSCEKNNSYDFDLINEIFGHFVRDNFRGNIEDAQYMTPAEVVDFMAEIALDEIKRKGLGDNLKICDPCCGVGSFLSVLHNKLVKEVVVKKTKLTVVGQDKVQRMARLTKINLALFDNNDNTVSTGNSLIGESELNNHQGSVDVILTNPPFGAKFDGVELKNEQIKYPLLNSIFEKGTGSYSSEVLFIDRCISLLKEGGFLLAVIPDNVISASGISSTLRQKLIKNEGITLRGIIELPAVTFAQAGTRTKTSILFLEKNNNFKKGVFVGICDSLGFEVSLKKGVANKYSEGTNELPALLEGYKKINSIKSIKNDTLILSNTPSSVFVNEEVFKLESWTASHFHVQRFQAIERMRSNDEVKAVKLSDVASFESKFRGKAKSEKESKCISVLHVINGDMLALKEVFEYNPKYPGYVCKPGDLLFSKINPRIPRMLIVPDLGIPLTCSTEFEIIKGKNGISNEELKILIGLSIVQDQILNLTSGTSASHNRIKSKDLANVMIPLPIKGTLKGDEFNILIKFMDENYTKMMTLNIENYKAKDKIKEII